MLLLYEYSNQNITEFQAFCNNSLSQEEKEKIFIPTYVCMKKYQGTWHIEPLPRISGLHAHRMRKQRKSDPDPESEFNVPQTLYRV